jgi:hypothetical protein
MLASMAPLRQTVAFAVDRSSERDGRFGRSAK